MNHLLTESVTAPPIVAFKDRARAISPKNHRTFDLSQAVPSFPTFQRIRDTLKDALLNDETSFYTDVPGIPRLRERIATTHPLKGGFDSRDVLITAGANHAMYTALTLLFNHGDRIALLEPYYFNYDMAAKMIGLKPEFIPLTAESDFQMDAASLIVQLEKSDAKGLILITPNNPTGACYAASEVLKLLQWTSPRGIHVILDETYLRFDPNHLLEPALKDFVGRGFYLVGSFSKSYSLTGYRVGYLIAGTELMREALKVQDTMIICAPHISQVAALAGLEVCDAELQAKTAEIGRLSETLRVSCQELIKFRLASCGAFFAYLEHPMVGLGCEEATLKLYENTGILGLPGTVFGSNQHRCIRLAFCNVTDTELRIALEELKTFERSL